MKTRYILPLVALITVVVIASLKPVLRAQQTSVGGAGLNAESFQRPFGGGRARQVLGRLRLTTEQKKAGLAVLRTHRPFIKPLLDGLTKERTALQALSKAPTVDEAAIRAQSARMAGIEADLAVQRAHLAHDLRSLATPEQLQTLDEVQAERAARRTELVQRISAWIANS